MILVAFAMAVALPVVRAALLVGTWLVVCVQTIACWEFSCHAQLEITPQFGVADWEPIPISGP